jgi:uncharacterized protein (TIGR02147 family)
MKDPVQFLAETLSERMAHKPGYSLRAFARDLAVSPQQLSNILNGRRSISNRLACQVSEKLSLGTREKEIFCESARATFSKHQSVREAAETKLSFLEANTSRTKSLELDLFKAVSTWYHFTLVELVKMSKNRKKPGDTNWFAKKLGISENEVKLALLRLERLELISKTKQGWSVNQDVITADQGIPTEAVRSFHHQILEKATQALTFQTQNERYGSSTTLPIKVKNLARARILIQEFRERFNQELAEQDDADEVYGLSMQFFRITENKE